MNVFPIGHYSGLRPGDEPVHVVRVGWHQHRLSEDAFGVWVLAHGMTQTGKGRWTTAEVAELAQQAGLGQPDNHLDELLALGALALVPDESAEAIDFARKHRMDVLFVGLGNTAERPDEHAVGVPGLGTAAVLDPDCYELWQWGSVAPTLWHSCEVRATVTAELGQTLEPVDALAEILGDLRFLVAHGCAYLDVVG
ncbi:hypothetical protein Kfla_0754 [Kribbella flavida DSM 17836]|uniref:Uncharacterized protein n=1 Tax=Kribbella flavida (strain DSM 17836 / JCM 10339 / NBRC 14399) TaxID=479435 RepID=D2PYM7_KRIFD|nr:hypothetical protein [Kribbella flavida]ADB29873.1 hypothetical protein Kfla_0754 [Kribbella flavida DSM 17836]